MNIYGLAVRPWILTIGAIALTSPVLAQTSSAVEFAHVLDFEAEEMELGDMQGMWVMQPRPGTSNRAWLVPNPEKIPDKVPATQTLEIPVGGTWYLWARYSVHPVRGKPFTVSVESTDLIFAALPFGETFEERPEVYQDVAFDGGSSGLIWTRLPVELAAGTVNIKLINGAGIPPGEPFRGQKIRNHPPDVDAFVLTNDPSFIPMDSFQ